MWFELRTASTLGSPRFQSSHGEKSKWFEVMALAFTYFEMVVVKYFGWFDQSRTHQAKRKKKTRSDLKCCPSSNFEPSGLIEMQLESPVARRQRRIQSPCRLKTGRDFFALLEHQASYQEAIVPAYHGEPIFLALLSRFLAKPFRYPLPSSPLVRIWITSASSQTRVIL